VQGLVTFRARGQALIETAIALPVFLVIMFGVIWALQTGVLGERVEMVARYGGMVSAEISPYQQYSLYAAYAAAAGSPLTTTCATPPPALLQDGTPLAAPATATLPFWQPSTGSETATAACGKTLETGGGLSAPMLLGRANIQVNAATDVPAMLQPVTGTQSSRGAVLNAFQSPDMATLIGCYGELQAAFERSVNPQSDPSAPNPPQPISGYQTGSLALSGGCGS
jgi:hypothetical protein